MHEILYFDLAAYGYRLHMKESTADASVSPARRVKTSKDEYKYQQVRQSRGIIPSPKGPKYSCFKVSELEIYIPVQATAVSVYITPIQRQVSV